MLDDARYLRRRAGRAGTFGCWGAQCVLGAPPEPPAAKRRAALGRLISAACAALVLLALALCLPAPESEPLALTVAAAPAEAPRVAARDNRLIGYRWPEGLKRRAVVFTRRELLYGRLMLVDESHRVPDDAPAPNTLSIAQRGQGMIPVRELDVKCGAETLDALYRVFAQLRQNGVEGLAVTRGTLSRQEQLALQLQRVEALAARMSLPEAAEAARREVADPGASDHQLPYTVDIRVFSAYNGQPDPRPPAATEQGRALLQLCWRYGFVQRYPGERDDACRAHEFRYVGLAHAAAMTYLDLALDDYLALLHEKERVVVYGDDGATRYVIVCAPLVDGYAEVALPDGATNVEASLDNTGYAVVACEVG